MRLPLFRLLLTSTFALVASSVATAASAEPICARTPELALRMQPTRAASIPAAAEGYRIATVRWDPLLNQRWATIASCAHPERPTFALRLPDAQGSSAKTGLTGSALPPFPVVHAGDLVQMWSQEQNLRIEAAGRAEETAAAGSRVRVRLLHTGFDLGEEQTLVGIVRGPGNVEIRR